MLVQNVAISALFTSGTSDIVVSAYAPTITNPDEVKDKFYDDLDSVIFAAPGQTNSSSSGTSLPEWHRPPDLGRSDWI